jgi:7-keto-8-aminopelargonate synthetase-like enzyme
MAIVMVGEPEAAVSLGETLFDRSVLAPAIRPPTVPAGTSRIRLTPTAIHSAGDVDSAVSAFPDAAEVRA